jgi:hypothetical protein
MSMRYDTVMAGWTDAEERSSMMTSPCRKAMMGAWPAITFRKHVVDLLVLFAFGPEA